MDSSSYRSQFIQSYIETENLSEKTIQVWSGFWNRIARAEVLLEKNLEDGYSKEDYINLIEKLNVTSYHVLMPTKSRIGQYLKWLCGQGVIEQQSVDALYSISYDEIKSEAIYNNKYFKDFGSLQDAIDNILWTAEKVDDGVFATQISAIYLAWCGLTIEEALQLKKADVGDTTITVGDRVISPINTIMSYILDYRDATEYQTQARGIITLKYVPTDWLFRSARSDHINSPRVLRIFIHSFTKCIETDDTSNIFNYDRVYWSGVFNRAYIYECANGAIKSGEIEKMEMLFGEKYASVSYANKRLFEYQRFKQHFFPVPLSTPEKA